MNIIQFITSGVVSATLKQLKIYQPAFNAITRSAINRGCNKNIYYADFPSYIRKMH